MAVIAILHIFILAVFMILKERPRLYISVYRANGKQQGVISERCAMDCKKSISPDKMLERLSSISSQICVDINGIKTVTVETVLRKYTSFKNSSYVIEGNQECDLSDEPDHIVGLLVGFIKSSLRADKSFCVVFEDETGQIPCCIVDVPLNYFNEPVIITEWNYIASSCIQGYDSYIEICSLLPVDPSSSDAICRPRVVPAFAVNSARFFQYNRDVLKKELINVIGRVRALSELLRLKDCIIFLVQLEDLAAQGQRGSNNCISILVRDFKFLHWQTILRPHRTYVFTGMRLTTLNPPAPLPGILRLGLDSVPVMWFKKQGEKTEEKVYICSSKSDLIVVGEENIHKVEIVDLKVCDVMFNVYLFRGAENKLPTVCADHYQNYLKNRDIHDYEALSAKWPRSTESDSSAAQYQSFTCVEGTVSNNSCAADGILDLDDKIRLYLTHSSWQSQIQQLRVGTRVSVYNAHFHVTAEAPKMRFFCCTYGCIKATAFSSSLPNPLISSIKQALACSRESVIVHLAREFGFSLGDLESVLHARQMLQIKLEPKVVSCSDDVLLKLFSLPVSAAAPLLRRRDRNVLIEFFDVQHAACQQQPLSFSIPSLEEIVQFCQRIALKRSASSYNPTSSAVDISSCWQPYVIQSSELKVRWVIVGLLKVNRLSSRLQLVDQTGAIDCVVASEHVGETETVAHRCAECDCQRKGAGDNRHSCPYLQTSCLDRVYRLDRFQLVVETFIGPNFNTVFRMYIQFSMLEAVPLFSRPLTRKAQLAKEKPSSSRRETKTSAVSVDEVADKLRTTSCVDQNFKLPTPFSMVPPSGMIASAVKSLDLNSCNKQLSPSCFCSVFQFFVVDYCEAVTLKSRIPGQLSLCCSVSGRFVGPALIDGCGCSFPKPVLRKSTFPFLVHVALNLQDHALKWFPILHSGCIYRLSKRPCRDICAFNGKPGYPSQMKSGLPKAATRLFLSIGDDVEVERVDMQTFHDMDKLSVEEIDAACRFICEVLDRTSTKPDLWQNHIKLMENTTRESNLCRDLVCISGVIVARGFGQPQGSALPSWKPDANLEKLGMSMPVDVPVKLTVRDLSSPVQIDVYLDLDRVQYPLGLLVGATVRLERLERKVSQANRCYCRFLIVSSCTILELPSCMSRNDGSQLVDLSSCVKIYLADLWYRGVISAAAYLITGHVCLVYRIVLKIDRTRSPAVYTAQASFLIDDGTSTSFVSCSGNQVADLLDLDAAQWSALKDLVIPVGEVVYNFQMRPPKSSARSCVRGQTDNETLVDCFLHELCDSSIVRRSITIVARRYRTILKGIGERYTDISSWRLTDFERKSVRKGSQTVETAVLPSLQLECIEFIKSRMSLNVPG